MTCDLQGLIQNAARCLQCHDPADIDPDFEGVDDTGYYAESLRQFAGHIQELKDDPNKWDEFIKLYNLPAMPEAQNER